MRLYAQAHERRERQSDRMRINNDKMKETETGDDDGREPKREPKVSQERGIVIRFSVLFSHLHFGRFFFFFSSSLSFPLSLFQVGFLKSFPLSYYYYLLSFMSTFTVCGQRSEWMRNAARCHTNNVVSQSFDSSHRMGSTEQTIACDDLNAQK